MQVSERVTDEGGEVDDGLVEDSIEKIVDGVENLANSEVVEKVGEGLGHAIGAVHDTVREGVKIGTEATHKVARAVNAADGVTPEGMPEIEDSAEVAERLVDMFESEVEGLATSTGEAFDTLREYTPGVVGAVDPSGAMEEAVEACAGQAGETVMEWIGEAALEEAAESVAELVPGVGAVIPFWLVVNGTAKATAGACGLVAGGSIALVGGLYGAAAAPFDGGASWGNAMNASRTPSAWGASMGAEGGLIAAKGALGFANQVFPPQDS